MVESNNVYNDYKMKVICRQVISLLTPQLFEPSTHNEALRWVIARPLCCGTPGLVFPKKHLTMTSLNIRLSFSAFVPIRHCTRRSTLGLWE